MTEEQLCPNCNQVIEDGAIYCGNCGYKLEQSAKILTTHNNSGIPEYSVPKNHHKQHWAAMALAFAVLAIAGGVLIPILGIIFGITSIVLATSSYRITHGWLRPISVVASIAAVLISVAFWVNTAAHNIKLASENKPAGISNGVASIRVTTPCYSLSFDSILNVNNTSGSCTLNAYNGSTFDSSSVIYKVISTENDNVDSINFVSFSKNTIEADISKNLSGFNISSEVSSSFDNSPAYVVTAYNSSGDVSIIEEVVLHPSVTKDNLFDIIHATNGQTINLSYLESSWRWNY